MKTVILFDKATMYLEILVIHSYTFESALGFPAMSHDTVVCHRKHKR